MRILTFSTLYPNAALPGHGLFVEARLRHLLASGVVDATVVAPVPWFPLQGSFFGDYAKHARAPREEVRNGIRVMHPRYVVLPKIGMSAAPALLYAGVLPLLRRLQEQGQDFDLIDAHYFYPDGVAAVMLGQRLAKPVVVTARGTDVNLIPEFSLPRRMIMWAARHAAGVVTVSQALKDRLVALGASAGGIDVLRNGVDLDFFRPLDRETARRELGYRGRTLLSVGNLVPLKGHDLVIRALPALPGCELVIAGQGAEGPALQALARASGAGDRIRFAGALTQAELRRHYCAADALLLASSREGWANVLLESMACGTPVVATDVGGTPEAVAAPEAGVLITERTPAGIAGSVQHLFANSPDRAATRRYAEQFSWAATTRGQIDLFQRILAAKTQDVRHSRHHPA